MHSRIIKNEEKAFYKTQYPDTINPPPALKKLGIEEMYLKIVKAKYD